MKKLILILLLSLSVIAQTPTPNQPTAEDIKQAKEAMKVLLNEPKTSPSPEKLTVADAMDRGLDMVSGYVSTLEGVVSKFAPEVWRIMITQQYAKAVATPVFPGFLLLLIVFLRKVLKGYFGVEKGEAIFKQKEGDSSEKFSAKVMVLGVLPAIASFILGTIFIYQLSESIMVLINPEYYALKDIINMLR